MAKSKSGLVASAKAVDPALDALFSASAGPVKAPPKSRYAELLAKKAREASPTEEAGEEDSEMQDEGEGSGNSGDSEEESPDQSGTDKESEGSSPDEEAAAAEVLEAVVSRGPDLEEAARNRKRKQRDEYDNLESKHLHRLANEAEPAGKRRKGDTSASDKSKAAAGKGEEEPSAHVEDKVPVHESLAADPAAMALDKANRTVFLSNVSVQVMKLRRDKKALMDCLSSVCDKKASPPQKIESIRFRSTAYEDSAIPKKAAYIKKSVMDATTKSTNAYVVYNSPAPVRLAVAELNGSIVLDRHLRVDSVAHPSPIDHRRCVFVGNLGFVDDESIVVTKIDEEGKEVTVKKKRTKVPMDVEEGLWRVFGKEAGKVESVRVVRDPVTRVGKGIAYVQFYDANAVESAVLLNGKKFPPMLPRELRVSRCMAPHKTARAMEVKHDKFLNTGKPNKKKGNGYVPKVTAEDKTLAGRAAKLLGRAAATELSGEVKKKKRRLNSGAPSRKKNRGAGLEASGEKPMKSPEDIVFEGRRASEKDGRPKDLKFKGAKGQGKKKNPKGGRAAARAAKWKANGGAK
ncbi:nucleolar protein 12 [Echria macrotheca]|uniref:Nucleolar protein 12 n=1 Tax=Echria macrotheca TaxID=438768 RepID=A0AAJ0FBB9_9PEZI|nr:nucleolar protein 12 [Echria macrotheca]